MYLTFDPLPPSLPPSPPPPHRPSTAPLSWAVPCLSTLHHEDVGGVNPSPYPVAADGGGSPAAADAAAAVVAAKGDERGERRRGEEEAAEAEVEEGGGEKHWLDGEGSDKLPDTAPGAIGRKEVGTLFYAIVYHIHHGSLGVSIFRCGECWPGGFELAVRGVMGRSVCRLDAQPSPH